jgi:hypothetical protein
MSRTVLHRRRLGAASVIILAAATAAVSAAGPAAASGSRSTDHSYRHGLVPTLQHGRPETVNQHRHGLSLPGLGGVKQLKYGGGTSGVGVTTGSEKVYIVFWGSQWGAQGTDASGNATFTGDPKGEAPRIQNFIAGLGTNNEGWSRVMAQYCEGVAKGATTCPSTAPHVAYPSSKVLAGVWYDNGAAAPSQATQAQLGQEAVNAAGHFGNTTATSNRNAQYLILSPTGTHPDGYNTTTSNWCAWHDWTGDVGVSSPYGGLAFTNDPYIPDMGSSCGQNFVHSGSAGTLDGVTIVMGHEYAETITDQFPAGGWTDVQGSENADKCAWISSGQGAATDVTFGNGSYPVQSTWSNAFNGGKGGCVVSQ